MHFYPRPSDTSVPHACWPPFPRPDDTGWTVWETFFTRKPPEHVTPGCTATLSVILLEDTGHEVQLLNPLVIEQDTEAAD